MSFEHAPVSKGLIVGCGLSSITVGLFDVKHYFHLQLVPHISRHHQYWRLGLHHFAFSNSSDLFLALLVLYSTGVVIERRFGSIKFASFILTSLFVSTILEFVALILFHRVGLNHIPSGPSALVFNILYQYSRSVPFVYQFRIFGIPLNNKSFTYVLASQLALSHLPGSGASALVGVLTGMLYRSDIANLKAYRVSPQVVSFARNYLRPLIGTTRPQRRSNLALPDGVAMAPGAGASNTAETLLREEVVTTARRSEQGGTTTGDGASPSSEAAATTGPSVMREWVNELTGRTDRANAGIRVPTDSEVVQVSTMFPDLDRDVIVAALQRSSNIEAAVETLLGSQTQTS
ncbi:hypothetical protein EYR40_005028 [Pleurotus pulmonarius]|nr:hypothetical protein EYR36_006594 [Pleurotus pulmonarius]KAF4601293.1 hypothetical protein EYR38_005945 [Pleurotus pulmonarius]KAF4601828.1 hypothetical protein EYR40_005028 [Pleurotus pulmonarius]